MVRAGHGGGAAAFNPRAQPGKQRRIPERSVQDGGGGGADGSHTPRACRGSRHIHGQCAREGTGEALRAESRPPPPSRPPGAENFGLLQGELDAAIMLGQSGMLDACGQDCLHRRVAPLRELDAGTGRRDREAGWDAGTGRRAMVPREEHVRGLAATAARTRVSCFATSRGQTDMGARQARRIWVRVNPNGGAVSTTDMG